MRLALNRIHDERREWPSTQASACKEEKGERAPPGLGFGVLILLRRRLQYLSTES